MLYLAHWGDLPRVESVNDLTIEYVTHDTARDYEVVRAKSFADSEEEPDGGEVTANSAAFSADLDGSSQLLLARIGDEPVSIAGWYEGDDRLIFHLATRLPFRHRGIARYLLSHIVRETYEQGRRSVTIFSDPEDSPIHFYRRLGFTEEVYWQARYVYTPTPGEDTSDK